MEHKKFSDTKLNDWIFTIRGDWERCIKNDCASDYPIRTKQGSYTNRGMLHPTHKHPSAWTYDPFNNTAPPREFIKGHWYPFVDRDGYSGVYVFDGEAFRPHISTMVSSLGVEDMKWIGESLGKIEFPDIEDIE